MITKYLMGTLALLTLQALANPPEETALWNSDGDSLYRLVRVPEVIAREADPERRIDGQIATLIDELEAEKPSRWPDTRRQMMSVRRILTDPVLRPVYDLFFFAARNGLLKKAAPGEVETALGAAMATKLKGSWSGLYHLHLFEGYEDFRREIQDFSASVPEDHFHIFDEYLQTQGITGFAEYVAQFTQQAYTRQGVVADFVRNWRLSRSARLWAGACAVGLLGFTGGYMMHNVPPAERMQQEMDRDDDRALDPQKRADEAAKAWGEEAARKILPARRP